MSSMQSFGRSMWGSKGPAHGQRGDRNMLRHPDVSGSVFPLHGTCPVKRHHVFGLVLLCVCWSGLSPDFHWGAKLTRPIIDCVFVGRVCHLTSTGVLHSLLPPPPTIDCVLVGRVCHLTHLKSATLPPSHH